MILNNLKQLKQTFNTHVFPTNNLTAMSQNNVALSQTDGFTQVQMNRRPTGQRTNQQIGQVTNQHAGQVASQRGQELLQACNRCFEQSCRNPIVQLCQSVSGGLISGCVDRNGVQRIHPNLKNPLWRQEIDMLPNMKPCNVFTHCAYQHPPNKCPEKEKGGCDNCKYGGCENRHLCSFGHNPNVRIEKLKNKEKWDKKGTDFVERQLYRDGKLADAINTHNNTIINGHVCFEWPKVDAFTSPVDYTNSLKGMQQEWSQDTDDVMKGKSLRLSSWCVNPNCSKYHFGTCDYDGMNGKKCNNQYCKMLHRSAFITAFDEMIEQKKVLAIKAQKEAEEQEFLAQLLIPTEKFVLGGAIAPLFIPRRVKKEKEEIVIDEDYDAFLDQHGKRGGKDKKLRISNKNQRRITNVYDTTSKIPSGKKYYVESTDTASVEFDDTPVEMVIENFVIRDKNEEKKKKQSSIHAQQQSIRDALKQEKAQSSIEIKPTIDSDSDSESDSNAVSDDSDSDDDTEQFKPVNQNKMVSNNQNKMVSNNQNKTVFMNFQSRDVFDSESDDDTIPDAVSEKDSDSESDSDSDVKIGVIAKTTPISSKPDKGKGHKTSARNTKGRNMKGKQKGNAKQLKEHLNFV